MRPPDILHQIKEDLDSVLKFQKTEMSHTYTSFIMGYLGTIRPVSVFWFLYGKNYMRSFAMHFSGTFCMNIILLQNVKIS